VENHDRTAAKMIDDRGLEYWGNCPFIELLEKTGESADASGDVYARELPLST